MSSPLRNEIIAWMVVLAACRSHHETHDAASASASVSAPLTSNADEQPKTVVEVDMARLAAVGLTLADVEQAIVREHIRVTPRPPSSFVVSVRGPTSPAALLEIVIKVQDAALVRISDVARVSIVQ